MEEMDRNYDFLADITTLLDLQHRLSSWTPIMPFSSVSLITIRYVLASFLPLLFDAKLYEDLHDLYSTSVCH